ncbi:hypothetical protein ES703_49732 [subsurface metagenome]
MTLEEVIKLIQADIDDEDVEWDSPLGRAYKLSFEALKRHKALQESPYYTRLGPLPGETEK